LGLLGAPPCGPPQTVWIAWSSFLFLEAAPVAGAAGGGGTPPRAALHARRSSHAPPCVVCAQPPLLRATWVRVHVDIAGPEGLYFRDTRHEHNPSPRQWQRQRRAAAAAAVRGSGSGSGPGGNPRRLAMGVAWGWQGVGIMGLVWGWHGVSMGPHGVGMGSAWGWHGVGMGLAWGWHGVGMGLAWGWHGVYQLQPVSLPIDWPIGNQLDQSIRPTLAVSLYILYQCFEQLLDLDLDLDQLRRSAGKKRCGHDERNLAHQGSLSDLVPWSNARD
jgi:hypothetical protein